MSLRIEERFEVRAPVDRVWRYLVDPRQVVVCLPGAELTEVQNETTYLGRVKVKVGPVTAAYNGKATIVEQDEASHTVRIQAEGRETQGTGSAKMVMTSRLTVLSPTSTEVHVSADVDIVGKIVQFGRGMIESVNKQLFKQFTDCVRATLEQPAAPAPADLPAVEQVTGSLVLGGAPPAAPADATRVAAPLGTAKPVRVLPLIFRAIWEAILRLFRRPKVKAAGG
jgi:carbon monoxide dehydrogenase subunit G